MGEKIKLVVSNPEALTSVKNPAPFEPVPLVPELEAAAKSGLKQWLYTHRILKERSDLYDAVAMALELSEQPKKKPRMKGRA